MIRHGGVMMRIPTPPTDNFTPAPPPSAEDGKIKPVSILPVVFGAGLALLFILSNKHANFTFNLR